MKCFSYLVFLLLFGIQNAYSQTDTLYSTLYFENAKSECNGGEAEKIIDLKSKIGERQILYIYVNAHASEKGDDDYNWELSKKRAEHVRDLMISYGFKGTQIIYKFEGEKRPVSKNEAENRRAEITIAVKNPEQKVEPKVEDRKPIEEKKQTIKGRITDSKSGQGIVAQITLSYPSSYFSQQVIKSNAEGYYEYNLAPDRQVSVAVLADGYADTAAVKKYGKGESIEMNFMLPKAEILERINLENIYFAPSSAEILPESARALEYLYKQLKDRNDVIIEIRGHVNWPLQFESNVILEEQHYQLSFNRAKAVYEFLARKGIQKNIMKYKGYSNSRMVNPYATNEPQMSKNRRVEVLLMKR